MNSQARMKGMSSTFVLAVVLIHIGGCASYQVRVPDSDPLEKNYQGGRMHSIAWGAWYSPQLMSAECQGEGINDVRIKRNLLYDFASVITLGFWMPIDVEYRCKAPLGAIGDFPEAFPDGPEQP